MNVCVSQLPTQHLWKIKLDLLSKKNLAPSLSFLPQLCCNLPLSFIDFETFFILRYSNKMRVQTYTDLSLFEKQDKCIHSISEFQKSYLFLFFGEIKSNLFLPFYFFPHHLQWYFNTALKQLSFFLIKFKENKLNKK